MLCCEHIETGSPDGCKACRGTVDYGLMYDANQNINLEGYVDSDWAGSAIDRKRNSRCFFSMGLGVISWFSRKQSCVALSTAEAEYVTGCSASCEVVWRRKLLSVLFDHQLDATCIYYDNQSCVNLSENMISMTSQSISRSRITISRIWCIKE